MDRFIIKHKLDDDSESSVAGTSSGSVTHSTGSVSSKTVVHQYNETICPSDSFYLEKSSYILNALFVGRNWQTKLWFQVSRKKHFHTKHSHLCEKPVEYLKMLVADRTCQAKQWTRITTISDKIQEANYSVAEIVAKKK
jgi:hypothetical protein